MEKLQELTLTTKKLWEKIMDVFYGLEELQGDYETVITEMPEGPEKERAKEDLDHLETGYTFLDEGKDYVGMAFQPEVYEAFRKA